MNRAASLFVIAFFSLGSLAQLEPSLLKGETVRKVVTRSNPAQSYALYLPSTYAPVKQWPVVFIFDPGASGPASVSRMKEAAEKFGYIIVASNNSRNGPFPPQIEAAKAMWNDARQRFPLDPHRTYFAGFSIDDPDAFGEPEFASLKSDPEFKALLESLHPNKTE